MKFQSYNQELKVCTTQILDVFNDIQITRLNVADAESKTIIIPVVYGQRSRILKSLENKTGILRLPLMALSITSLTRDKSRVCDQNQEVEYRQGTVDLEMISAVPMNIGYQLLIYTKYQEDLDQILTNIIPFMNPDLYVSWPNPKDPSGEAMIKSQIIWDDNISITYEDDESSIPWRCSATVNFTYKSLIFPGTQKYDFTKGIILKINPRDIHSPSANYNQYSLTNLDYMSMFYDVPTTSSIDNYMLSSVPNGEIQYPRYDVMIQYPHNIIEISTYFPSGNFIGNFDATNPYHNEQISGF